MTEVDERIDELVVVEDDSAFPQIRVEPSGRPKDHRAPDPDAGLPVGDVSLPEGPNSAILSLSR